MKILAITLARGGSKRIPRKNIALINGKPLLEYTVNEVKKSKFINKYIVSTDDDEIINENNIIYYLKNEKLAGYGTDVIVHEFDDINNSELINLAKKDKYNIVITPHVGGMSIEGQTKAFTWAVKKFK